MLIFYYFRLTTVLIWIESELKQLRGLKSKSRSTNRSSYSPNVPFLRQALYLHSTRQILTHEKLIDFHLVVLDSVTNSLPFYKEEKLSLDILQILIGIIGNTDTVREIIIT